MKGNKYIYRLVINGVLAAVFFALTFLSVEVAGIKLTFDSLAVTVSAMLFGPADALIVGLVGAFLEQLVKYGFTATTLLWIIPPALRGLTIGLFAIFLKKFMSIDRITKGRRPYVYFAVCILASIITSVGNTFVYYVDAQMFGYYSFELIFGIMGVRIVTGIATSIITAAVSIPVIVALKNGAKNG